MTSPTNQPRKDPFHLSPTKRQVSKRQVSKCLVSKRLKRQVYKTSGLQNVRSSKRLVAKNIHIYSVLVVGGNPQVLLQPCLQAKGWPCFILYFRGVFWPYITIMDNNK
jgi:hypothetical protein